MLREQLNVIAIFDMPTMGEKRSFKPRLIELHDIHASLELCQRDALSRVRLFQVHEYSPPSEPAHHIIEANEVFVAVGNSIPLSNL